MRGQANPPSPREAKPPFSEQADRGNNSAGDANPGKDGQEGRLEFYLKNSRRKRAGPSAGYRQGNSNK